MMTLRSARPLLLWFAAAVAFAQGADRDADGFPDERDACPDRAESLGRYRTPDGCPDAAKVPVNPGNKRGTNDPSLLLGVIYFSDSSATVEGSDLAVLTQAVRRVQSSPNGGTVSLVGHADSGESADQVKLSNDRCRAVREAMAAAGVPTTRLGFCYAMGARVPAAPGSEDEQNRRVEITVRQSVYGSYSSGLGGDE